MSVGVLERLASVLDELRDTDVAALADGDGIVALHRQLDRLDGLTTRAVARFDAEGGFVGDGARSASAWIAARCRQPSSSARRRVRLGRALRHMPGAEAAWLQGDIGSSWVSVLAECRTTNPECFARDEAMLVEHALSLRFGSWSRAMAYWRYHADAQGAECRAERDYQGRELHVSATFANRWRLDGWLDAIGGSVVSAELTRIGQELLAEDWAEARARVGENATYQDLARSPAQRRADAGVEMARRSSAVGSGSRLPEPLFSVLVGYETFAGPVCELASRHLEQPMVVTPGSLARWFDSAWVERVVFDGPSRVLDVGVRRRLFSGATRRAVQLRDAECFHPLCEESAANCQVDHVQPWAAGGPTTQANGRVACGFHNRQRYPRRCRRQCSFATDQ